MRTYLALAACMLVFAEGKDDWSKVSEVTSGTELRVYKSGAKQPLTARMDQVTEGSLIVVVKNEQVAIPKQEIERIDYRPERKESRVKSSTTTKTGDNVGSVEERSGPASPGPTASTSTSLTVEGKGSFQTLYKRPAQK